MKQLVSFFILCAFASLFYGSATQKAALPPPTKQTFTYDYKTPVTSKPGSATILLSIIKPNYASTYEAAQSEIFETYRQFMANDIEELLVDKGFRLKGSFANTGEMVYNDKRDIDVVLEIEIEPKFVNQTGGWYETPKSAVEILLDRYAPPSYHFNGSVSLIGKINIVGKEPMSGEKIWIKSVQIPTVDNIILKTSSQNFAKAEDSAEFYNDPGIYNTFGAALQQHYKAILQKIDAHFDPREFTDLKPQIKELKNKKAY